jgi:hypothetical protein
MSAIGVRKLIEHEASILRARCNVNGMKRDCRVSDIKEGGLFVESFIPAITGSNVSLSFHLPNGHCINTTGVVTKHQFKIGFNVDFVQLSPTDREQINGFARV